MIICGIDPGLKGGIAFYTPTALFAYRTPVVQVDHVKKGKKGKRPIMDLAEAMTMLTNSNPTHTYLELVSAMPGQGVTGMFRFGQNLGQWEGILVGLGLDYTLVRPQVWKKQAGLIGAEKGDSIELARKTWPDHGDLFKYKTADEGRAEAALIARYGWNIHHEIAA